MRIVSVITAEYLSVLFGVYVSSHLESSWVELNLRHSSNDHIIILKKSITDHLGLFLLLGH